MSVFVSFVKSKAVGSVDNIAIGSCRARESLALGSGVTAAVTAADEMVLIVNGETAPVFVAFGTAPNANLAAETLASSAGVPLPAGGSIALFPPKGSKINARAVA